MKNKGERQRKKKVIFKRRLKDRGFTQNTKGMYICGDAYFKLNFNFLKTTSTPCSCSICSPGKVEDKAKYRLNKFRKEDIYE
jgi:hypothetical protein